MKCAWCAVGLRGHARGGGGVMKNDTVHFGAYPPAGRTYPDFPTTKAGTLCGVWPSTSEHYSRDPRVVRCRRCNARLESIARSLGAFADALRMP